MRYYRYSLFVVGCCINFGLRIQSKYTFRIRIFHDVAPRGIMETMGHVSRSGYVVFVWEKQIRHFSLSKCSKAKVSSCRASCHDYQVHLSLLLDRKVRVFRCCCYGFDSHIVHGVSLLAFLAPCWCLFVPWHWFLFVPPLGSPSSFVITKLVHSHVSV